MLVLLAILVLLAGFYAYQYFGLTFTRLSRNVSLDDKSASLPLDEETKAKIRHYFEGIIIEAKENDLNYAIHLDHSVGRPKLSEGKYKEAYRTYQKVLAISYRQGSLMGIGIALTILGDVSKRAGDTDEALFTQLLAYRVAQTMNNNEEAGVAELALAKMLEKKDLALSMMLLLRAKESLKGTRYKEDYVRLLVDLARALERLGESERASSIYEEAWDSARSLGDAPSQKWVKWEVGMAYADDLKRQGQYEKAPHVLESLKTLFSQPEKSSEMYTYVLTRLARLYSVQKRNAEATHHYLSAYANYELTRANAPGEQARANLDIDHKGLIDDFVEFHLQSSDYASALALLESNKARTLNDIFEDPSYKQVQNQWKELERRQAKEVMAFVEGEDDELSPLKKGMDLSKVIALFEKQDEERRKLQRDLRLQEMTATRSLSKTHVETIKRRLPSDVSVLSFFLRGDRASVFLLTRQGLQHFPLSLDAQEYDRAARQLRVALTNPHNDFYREPAQLLYSKALEPVLKALPKTIKILVYSPDGILSRIPLEALMDGEHFLGERYAVYRVPSLRYVTSIAGVKASPVQTGIACVDPDVPNARLPFQQETGEALKKFYGPRMLLLAGKECSESRLVAGIREQKTPAFLHIGAHGDFYPENAMDSTIWLSPEDGSAVRAQPWNAKAMATVDMSRLDLITLSSCETGLTDPKIERDVFGIGRALFFAGAKRIIAPLWSVHDQATAEFMQAFHRAYANNSPAVFALQQAQRSLIQTEKYRHPFYWSAFVLTGAAQ